MAYVDNKGRPVRSLLITCLTAIVLTYVNLSGGGTTALAWFVSITSAINWMVVSFTSWLFHKVLAVQNDTLFTNLYAWKSSYWPLAPAWLMTVSSLLLTSCIYVGAKPPGADHTTAANFFQYTIGIIPIVGLTEGYKVIFRAKVRNLETADLVTGQRKLMPEDIAQLDAYYRQPGWRRFLTYVKLW